ncbi:MAG: hypothetical protein CMN30_31665 [Sandaracinus sp.]|nr:hypothetical protein [Sandaracinus sp.]
MRWTLVAALAGVALSLPVGCDDDEEETGGESGETTAESGGGASGEGGGGGDAAPDDLRTHLDLVELAHLADVRHHGALSLDFGTTARPKYTSGDWNSGWGEDAIVDGEPVTRFGSMGRVYFPLEESGPLTIHVKLRGVGSETLIAYLNGETLGTNEVARGGFRNITLNAPASAVRTGENYLLLRSTDTSTVDGADVSFEVAEIRVVPGEGAEAPASPRPLRTRAEMGGQARDALRIASPGRWSWHVDVPEDATLVLGHAAQGEGVNVTVKATAEGGSTTELGTFSAGSRWGRQRIDLSALAGKVVRLDVAVSGGDALLLSEARVGVPRVELGALPQARNVVLLVIDTMRASKLKPYNSRTRVRTPALDQVAEEGTVFERAQAPENWTKPSVASILTSTFPATHGAKNDASRLPQTLDTLGEVYQGAGFQTASFIANGYVSRAFGFDQGWNHYTNYIREQKSTEAENVFGEAIEWMEEHHDDDRMFVYIQTIDPHVPYDPPDEYLHQYDSRTDYTGQVQNRRTHLLLEDAKKNPPQVTFDASDRRRLEALYDGEVSYHDAQLAHFMEKMDEMGLTENTIFVITSDHGEEFDDHGSWGHGHSIFQELIQVPLIVRWPGVTQPGSRVPQVVSTMDVGPTILEATGVDVPDSYEGRSLMGFLRGAPPPGPYVAFSDFQENRRVIRGGDWKLILRSSLTYVLFDLEADPGERNELNGRDNPIAMRYLRVMSGQQLGASDRTRWLQGGGEAVRHAQEAGEMNEEVCRQLVALGYMDCLQQFPGAI